MQISFTLIEKENSESPNIGTVIGSTEQEFIEKATRAIESHFDGTVTSLRIQDGLKFSDIKNSPPIDAYATIDGSHEAVIEIQQTWIY